MSNKEILIIALASMVMSIMSIIFTICTSINTKAAIETIASAESTFCTCIHTKQESTTECVETTEVVSTAKATTEKLVNTTNTTVTPTKAYDDIELIALITIAEAEGESEYGKRLVIDTILNRVDSPSFPNSVSGVIYQPHQFTCVGNGRLSRCVVTDDIRQLVREEMASRTNSDVIYFRTGYYSAYGTPALKEGNHYFSSH